MLDKLLVDAATEAGAELREGFTVEDLELEDGRVTGIRGHMNGGPTVTERARVVIGADGHHSLVARRVESEQYNEKPPLQVSYYTYVSGLPMDGRYEVHLRPDRGFAAWATNDNLTVVIAGWPRSELMANRGDIEGNVLATLALVPDFAARFHAATRETRFVGQSLANFMRKPFGAGWALVGDAGYTKDFITALGISDAFRDAERCASGLDEALSGSRPFEVAMGAYQAERDRRSLPFYEFTAQLAALRFPPPELGPVLAAVQSNQDSMDAFARVAGAVTSPAQFLSEQNVARLLAAAGEPSAAGTAWPAARRARAGRHRVSR